ncbi:phytanoyl-CoA dioxygenase family protein [Paenibacillus sp. PAMC21692]|uniref:phytanoyl-CoA dioxygenase family protein n=1 Tax=Paenibacillus sp. PAMC21692 TaxID=2762320 RepID=UPI00164EC5B7|nr:phytanoyl-CoA dioxygenase family protein [Paenibacillus sp. PAMC21692]QNK55678.1 phytanoyl-CoA dioxygenase family protein [Paenibacillus sp. PAMC21692]
MEKQVRILSEEQMQQFVEEGYVIVKGLFQPEELAEISDTFERIGQNPVPGFFEPDMEAGTEDPLKRYPRVMQPHRFNDTAKKYMLHAPVMAVLRELYGEEALAAQSMFYYKPPGSRGQALHQDNFYLQVEPGNCIAAWTAVDAADMENGGLLVVPRTGEHEISCPELADSGESFTTHYVKPPKDRAVVPAVMDPGDVLFFNGNLIHGSYRNKTKDRFRRAFICHYANASASRISGFYRPLFREDGTSVDLELNEDGGPCGVEFDKAYPH